MSIVGLLPTEDNSLAHAGANGFLGSLEAPLPGKADPRFPFVGFFSHHDFASPEPELVVDPEWDLTR
jgi:hypothetical protein